MDNSASAVQTGFDSLGLSDEVLAAVRDLGYTDPTPVQAASIPEILSGRDLMAAAQTGTGKTAAFLLPVMSTLEHVAPRGKQRRRGRGRGPLMLIVTPTRELAQQIERVCKGISRRTGHVAATVVGGVGYNPQRSALKNGCDILVATPGRLVDLLGEGTCNLNEVQVLVLDEADRMLDMGFLPDVRRIVSATPEERQTLLFSATLDEKAVGAIAELVHDPARVEIAPPQSTADTVDQYVLPVSSEAKNAALAEVLKREGAQHVIVFTRTKHRADACCRRLERAGIRTAPIHGNRTQGQRERALRAFGRGDVDVLVATDVLARGIDISDVRYVVNFDVPEEPTDYIHRIGRTGRAGEEGWALSFVTELDVQEFFDIEALMGKTANLYDVEGLELGVHPPVVDPDRVPETRSKKKTRRGKSTSKKKRGGRSAARADRDGQGERNGRNADRAGRTSTRGDRADKVAGERGKHSGAADKRTGSNTTGRGDETMVSWAHENTGDRPQRRRSASASAADGQDRAARKATRPAHPKRSGSVRVHVQDETAGDSTPRRERAARSERRADGRDTRGKRSRGGQSHGKRGGSTQRSEARAANAHDWRNSDYPEERRGRGGRGGRAMRNGAGRGDVRPGRSQGAKARTRRPGDFGGRRER